MKLRTSGILIAILLTLTFCKKEEVANNTATSATTTTSASVAGATAGNPVHVILRVSGAAELLTGMNPPVVLLPNFTAHNHQVILVALPKYVEQNGLPHTTPQFDADDVNAQGQEKFLNTYMYSEVPPNGVNTGVEIDLAASGVEFPNGSAVQMALDPQSNDECPAPNSSTPVTSLHWVPNLEKVSKVTQYTLDGGFTKKDPAMAQVVARMELKGGKLISELSPRQRAYRFVIDRNPADDDVKQTVSMSLQYEFDVNLPPGSPFVLKGRKFGTAGTNAGDFVVLGTFKADGGEIRLDLMNIPLQEFVHVHDSTTIPHFDLHYRLVPDAHKEAVPQFERDCASGNRPLFECGPVTVTSTGTK